ncbi:beta-propeller fold lactonase family protein [Rhizobium paranaense]|uniref:beta-propeller fold lactonase family protein n=1 Tax=Rhizobium paranaense TaxID=1650438 RepID=UPI001620D768
MAISDVGEDGTVAVREREPSQGRTPRFFALDPDEQYLCEANEDSDTIVQFRCDAGTWSRRAR